MDEAFCENGNCRVVMFVIKGEQTDAEPDHVHNCPGCGRFGRIKDTKGGGE